MMSASSTLMTAEPFSIHALSQTEWKLSQTMIQMNASSMTIEASAPGVQPVMTEMSPGHMTARDAIQSGKLTQ